MTHVNVEQAKEQLVELIGLLESKQKRMITITIDGEPVAKILRYDASPVVNYHPPIEVEAS